MRAEASGSLNIIGLLEFGGYCDNHMLFFNANMVGIDNQARQLSLFPFRCISGASSFIVAYNFSLTPFQPDYVRTMYANIVVTNNTEG